jgi:hypothetical protein
MMRTASVQASSTTMIATVLALRLREVAYRVLLPYYMTIGIYLR